MAQEPSETSNNPDKRPRRRWVRWLRDAVLLLVVFVLIQWWQARNLVEGEAPSLVGHLVDGSPYQLDVRNGPVLVHFWATWCPICKLEQDSIDSIAEDHPVITIATTSGTADEVSAYLAEHELSMPVLLDEGGDIGRAWGGQGVPATFIVDQQGIIRHAGMGYSSEIGLRTRLWIAD